MENSTEQKKKERNTVYLIMADFSYRLASVKNQIEDKDLSLKKVFKKYFDKYFPYKKKKEITHFSNPGFVIIDISSKSFNFLFFTNLLKELDLYSIFLDFFETKLSTILINLKNQEINFKDIFCDIKQYFIKHSLNNMTKSLKDMLISEQNFTLDTSLIIDYCFKEFDEITPPNKTLCISSSPYPDLKLVSLSKFKKSKLDEENISYTTPLHKEQKTILIENSNAKLMKTFLKNFTQTTDSKNLT